jgi:hypothetical protein
MSKKEILNKAAIVKMALVLGAENNELIQCLKKDRTRLILKNAKIQNFPKSKEAAAAIVTSFPQSAERIVRESLYKSLEKNNDLAIDSVVDLLADISIVDWGKKEHKKLMRGLFIGWCSGELNDSLITKLLNSANKSTVVGDAETLNESAVVKHTAQPFDSVGIKISADELRDCIGNRAEVNQSHADTIGNHFLRGVIHAAEGDIAGVETAIGVLSREIPDSDIFINAYTELLKRLSRRTGLQISSARAGTKMPDFDPESVLAIGEVSMERPGGIQFIRIVGPIIDSLLYEMSYAEALRHYPTRGDAFRAFDMSGPRLEVGDWCVIRVEFHGTHSSHFVVTSVESRLYRLVDVPFSTTEVDALRDYVGSEAYSPSVLRLSNGVFASAPNIGQPQRKVGVIDTLEVHDSLSGYELSGGRIFVRAPKSPAAKRIDLSPPLVSLRKIFKANASSSKFPDFTKDQVSELFAFSDAAREEKVSQSIPSLRTRLESVPDFRERLSEFETELLAIPSVKSFIDDVVQREKLELQNKISGEKQELARLVSEKKSKEATVRSLEAELESKRSNFRKELRKVYEDFKAKDERSLAEIIGLHEIMGGAAAVRQRGAAQSELIIPSVISTKVSSTDHISGLLQRASFVHRVSHRLLFSALVAARLSGIVGLIGGQRGRVLDALTQYIGGGVRCSVAVSGEIFSISDLMSSPASVRAAGSSVATSLGQFLSNRVDADGCAIVDINGVNRIAPEVVLPELKGLAVGGLDGEPMSWSAPDGRLYSVASGSGVIFFLNFVSGKSTFPICGGIARTLPLVVTDSFNEDAGGLASIPDSGVYGLTPSCWIDWLNELSVSVNSDSSNQLFESLVAAFVSNDLEMPRELASAMLLCGRMSLINDKKLGAFPQSENLLHSDAAVARFGTPIFADFD